MASSEHAPHSVSREIAEALVSEANRFERERTYSLMLSTSSAAIIGEAYLRVEEQLHAAEQYALIQGNAYRSLEEQFETLTEKFAAARNALIFIGEGGYGDASVKAKAAVAVVDSDPASESERVKGEGGTRGLATQEGKPVSDSQPPPVSRSESPDVRRNHEVL